MSRIPQMYDDNTYFMEVNAGLVVRGTVRNLLESEQCFYNPDMEYKENKGWLGSQFLIRGMRPSFFRQMQNMIAEFNKDK